MPRNATSIRDSELLSSHYRAIGPAAIMAALLCCKRERSKKDAKTV